MFTTSKKDNSRLSSVDRCLSPCGGGVSDDDDVEGDPEGYEGEAGDNPDFIPFTETPIVRYKSSPAKSGKCLMMNSSLLYTFTSNFVFLFLS